MAEKGLGKGLGALLGGAAESEAAQSPYVLLPIGRVEPNREQPRRLYDEEALTELADSIATHGLIQPLTVRRLPSGYYQIIAGERRWRASRMAGLLEVPAVVIEADDRRTMELALVENLQREDLNALESAEGFRALMQEYGLTQEETARRVGKSRSAVANALRLLTLPDGVKNFLEQGTLSEGHARALLGLPTAGRQEQAASRVIDGGLSVRQTEALVKKLLAEDKPEKTPAPSGVDYIAEAERQLSKKLGRGVSITVGRKKGRLELEFYGNDDLQLLLDALETMRLNKRGDTKEQEE